MFGNAFYTTGPEPRPGCRPHRGGRGFAHAPRGEFGGPPFGFGGGGRGWGRRARRGDIRTAALLLLEEEPRNGYQIMQEVQRRSGGIWSPSPGSVYPALSQLEDEGLIRTEEHDGQKLFALTDAGRKLLAERGSDRPAPWEQPDFDRGDLHELGRLMKEVGYAFAQVMRTGSSGQMAQARDVLADTRRALYRILADGAGDSESGGDNVEKS
jgi:DNA-binding PadR family transcriptional regulator